MPRLCCVFFVLLVATIGLAGAYSNPLSVPFKAQVPPGSWGSVTKNCGQTSSLMIFCYYKGIVPTTQGIKDIDDWLNRKYGAYQPINGYNGAVTDTTILTTLAKEYGGFPSSYKATGWDVKRVKEEIDLGHPVIVAVKGVYLGQNYGGHFLVAKGYTSTDIITNDPGRSNGMLTYSNAQFENAMSSQGGAVVVIVPNPAPAYTAIKLVYPTGGEIWPMWSTKQIQWIYTGISPSSVKIQLLKGTQVITVASSAPAGSGGRGSYSMLVNQGAGQYRVKVTLNGVSAAVPSATSGTVYVT